MTPTSLTNYVAMTSGYTGHMNGQEILITGTKLPPVWPQVSVSIFRGCGERRSPVGRVDAEQLLHEEGRRFPGLRI
jgi:hypothetical protein